MESIHQFELILMSKMREELSPPPKCSSEDIFGESFSEDLLFNDEFHGIELLADLDQDEKSYLEELQQITERIDLPLYDIVTGNDVASNFSYEDSKHSQKSYEIIDFETDCGSDVTPEITPAVSPSSEQFYLQNIPTEENNFYAYEIVSSSSSPSSSSDQGFFTQNSPFIEQDASNVIQPDTSYATYDSMSVDAETIADTIENDLKVVDEIIEAHSRSQSVLNSDFDDKSLSSWSNSLSYSPRSECSVSTVYDYEPKKKHSRRGVTKKRARTGRNLDEKRSRKKEQNKNAATRYRIKKKEEVHVILDEERSLMDRHKKLSTTFKDTKREVKYLKSLLRELFQARGFNCMI